MTPEWVFNREQLEGGEKWKKIQKSEFGSRGNERKQQLQRGNGRGKLKPWKTMGCFIFRDKTQKRNGREKNGISCRWEVMESECKTDEWFLWLEWVIQEKQGVVESQMWVDAERLVSLC